MEKILTFEPVFVHLIWGGNRIAAFKGIASQGDDIGESWELSPMPGHESVVDSGIFKGRTLLTYRRIRQRHNGGTPHESIRRTVPASYKTD